MKITEHIKNANGKTLFSLEVIPPQKGIGIEDLYKNIDPLMELSGSFGKANNLGIVEGERKYRFGIDRKFGNVPDCSSFRILFWKPESEIFWRWKN